MFENSKGKYALLFNKNGSPFDVIPIAMCTKDAVIVAGIYCDIATGLAFKNQDKEGNLYHIPCHPKSIEATYYGSIVSRIELFDMATLGRKTVEEGVDLFNSPSGCTVKEIFAEVELTLKANDIPYDAILVDWSQDKIYFSYERERTVLEYVFDTFTAPLIIQSRNSQKIKALELELEKTVRRKEYLQEEIESLK